MNLYILTSILNIDNILSSESISPICFYERRKFGYNYFETMQNLNIPVDKIVLFDYLPYMEIVDPEQINYPCVLEIDDPEQFSESNIKKWKDGIYFSNKTLYINPFNCRVLFFSTEAYKEVELRCTDSKTNKLYRYYRKSLVQKNEAKDISNINLPITTEDVKVDDLIKTDERFNSRKGFLLGWYLGSGKNIDPVLAKLKSIEKRTYDYVSAIKNNNGVVSPTYREALSILDKQYKNYDPNLKKLQELWDKELTPFCFNQDEFNLFLKKYGMESELKNAFSKVQNIPHRKSFSIENYELFMSEMTNYTNILQQSSQPSYSFYNETDSVDSKLYGLLINKLFFDNRFSLEDLRINRSKVAINFITEIKQFIVNNGQRWENGSEHEYLRSLMFNITKNDSFDFSSTQNDLLKSVAAFLLKGEDYKDMMSYLQNNAMSNYCYVLGLWGAACGYVDMPKSITNVLFDFSDLRWSHVYKKMHKEVYGYVLVGVLDATQEKVTKVDAESSTEQGKTESSLPIHNDDVIAEQNISEDDQISHNSSETDTSTEWETKLKEWETKWDKKGINRDTILNFWKEYGRSEQFITNVAKIPGIGDKKISALRSILSLNKSDGPSIDLFSNTADRNSISQKTLSKYPKESKFLLSLDSLKSISNIAMERLIDTFAYTATEKNKDEHIKYFTSICINEGRGCKTNGEKVKDSRLLRIYTEELNKKVKSEIETRYNEYR